MIADPIGAAPTVDPVAAIAPVVAAPAGTSVATGRPVSPVVHGVDVDALAAAVRSCPAVADLDPGRAVQSIATYLPGRQVGGIRVTDTATTVQFVLRWGASVSEAASQIRSAVGGLTGGRPIDLVVSAVTDPPAATVATG